MSILVCRGFQSRVGSACGGNAFGHGPPCPGYSGCRVNGANSQCSSVRSCSCYFEVGKHWITTRNKLGVVPCVFLCLFLFESHPDGSTAPRVREDHHGGWSGWAKR